MVLLFVWLFSWEGLQMLFSLLFFTTHVVYPLNLGDQAGLTASDLEQPYEFSRVLLHKHVFSLPLFLSFSFFPEDIFPLTFREGGR